MALDVVRVVCAHDGGTTAVVVPLFRDPDDGQGWSTGLAYTSTVRADLPDHEWPADLSSAWLGAQANSPGPKRVRVLLECASCGAGRDTLARISTLEPILDTLAEHGLREISLSALLKRLGSRGIEKL